MIKGNEKNLLKKYNDILSNNKAYKKPNKFGATEFIVCHFAGEVMYEISGFIEKNRDTLSDVISNTLSQSKSSLISHLYAKDIMEESGS